MEVVTSLWAAQHIILGELLPSCVKMLVSSFPQTTEAALV